MKRRTRSAAFIAAILLGISLAGCGEADVPSPGDDMPGAERPFRGRG